MIYECNERIVLDGNISEYRLDNNLHEQVLCFIHALDSSALSSLYALGASLDDGRSVTVYIPRLRDGASNGERNGFLTSLCEFLSSLDGALFAAVGYCEDMREALESIDCGLIFEAE